MASRYVPDAVSPPCGPAMAYVPIERLVVAPDCGMKYLPRDVAFGKLKAMVDGAAMVRNAP
jgi:5-methyltetrahydropteroyltriglutamate--homocysteine methyltransferase